MTDNDQSNVLAPCESPAEEFMRALITGTKLDFEIVCGDHRWAVHLDLLKRYSGYFRSVSDGDWQENKERKVTLTDMNPWDIARMLRFIYTDDLDNLKAAYRTTFHTVTRVWADTPSPTLANLMRINHNPWLKDTRSDQERRLAKFETANYFDVPKLREHVAQSMVGHLKSQFEDRHSFSGLKYPPSNSRDLTELPQAFAEVYDLLEPFLHVNLEMEKVEMALVDFLMGFKSRPRLYGSYGPGSGESTAIPLLRERVRHDIDDGPMERLNSIVRSYAYKNATFAVKIAERLEYRLDFGSDDRTY